MVVKEWIAKCLWDGLKLFAGQVHDWVFDPQRAAKKRFKDRERWWAYRAKAAQTQDKRDDMRAEWFRIRFNFEVSPEEAIARGDLDPQAREIAMRGVEQARAIAGRGMIERPAGLVSPELEDKLREQGRA